MIVLDQSNLRYMLRFQDGVPYSLKVVYHADTVYLAAKHHSILLRTSHGEVHRVLVQAEEDGTIIDLPGAACTLVWEPTQQEEPLSMGPDDAIEEGEEA